MRARSGFQMALSAASLLLTIHVLPAAAQDVLGGDGLKGAGSTFAYPLLSQWSREYRDWMSRGGDFAAAGDGLAGPSASTSLEYEPIGSLAGTLRLKDRAVDFGVSDMPLTSEELASLGLAQFPIAIGGVAVVINLPGIGPGQVHLTGAVLADIFLGKLSRWSDPAIAALNGRLKLPDTAVKVIHRAEGSGTTFNFAEYLSRISPEWKTKVGAALLVQWPTGSGAKGNEGVGQMVRATPGSIGYIDYAQASEMKLAYVSLQNRAGRFVAPEPASFSAASSSVDWGAARDFHVSLTNAASRQAYPIAATMFALMHKNAPARRVDAALEFFRWSLERGAGTATRLGYVPLPAALVRQVTAYWDATFTSGQ